MITGEPSVLAVAAAGEGFALGGAGSPGRGAGLGLLNHPWRFDQSNMAEIVSAPDYPGQRLVDRPTPAHATGRARQA